MPVRAADTAAALCRPCPGRAGVDAGPGRGWSCSFPEPAGLGWPWEQGLEHGSPSVLRVRAGPAAVLLLSSTEGKNYNQ